MILIKKRVINVYQDVMHQLRSVNVHTVGERIIVKNAVALGYANTTSIEVLVKSVGDLPYANTTYNELIVKSVGDLPYDNTTKNEVIVNFALTH